MFQPKVVALFVFTSVFAIFISGLFWLIIFIPLTALLMGTLTYFSFEQLPEERLQKFAQVFDLRRGKHRDGSSSSGSENVALHRIILHRGGIVNAPENTLPAIQEAAKQGVVGVEVDLQFTLDGVGILLHDDMLERTTNATGDVRLKCFAELEGVNAAAKHKYGKDKGAVKIPTLEECLKECLRLNLLVFIDCKAFAQKTADLVDQLFTKYPALYDTATVCSFYPNIIKSENTADLVDQLFTKYPALYDTATVCSFYPNIIYYVRRKNPRVITALTYRKMALSCEIDCATPRFDGLKHYLYTCLDHLNTILIYAWAWRVCGNSFLLINKEGLCRNELNWWSDLGVRLLVWTVNSPLEKQFCLDHLCIPIITDSL
ncbi:hypothetical protein ACOMHN_041370 [Nucella lapillus]